MSVYPLVMAPIFKERIWGADNLRRVFDKELPPDKKIGESWELADLPHDKTVVANGPLQGLTLEGVIQREGRAITGRAAPASPFPLLVKFLDCADVLSVQVHPDAQACRRLGKGDFKTECWYVLRAQPGACIYKGLRPGVTRQSFAQAITAGDVEAQLHKVTVREGECHYLPAGTPHSIGPGLLLVEIQTPSDTTYRVFDWNRVDDQGRGRALHILEALECIHFDASGDDLAVRTRGRLVDSPYFSMEKKSVPRTVDVPFPDGIMEIIVVLSGAGRLHKDDVSVPVRAGQTVLVPAAFTGVLSARDGGCEYLSVML